MKVSTRAGDLPYPMPHLLFYLFPGGRSARRLDGVFAGVLGGVFSGAIATHVRVESPLLTHTFFSIYVAAFIWGGALLRNEAILKILMDARRR